MGKNCVGSVLVFLGVSIAGATGVAYADWARQECTQWSYYTDSDGEQEVADCLSWKTIPISSEKDCGEIGGDSLGGQAGTPYCTLPASTFVDADGNRQGKHTLLGKFVPNTVNQSIRGGYIYFTYVDDVTQGKTYANHLENLFAFTTSSCSFSEITTALQEKSGKCDYTCTFTDIVDGDCKNKSGQHIVLSQDFVKSFNGNKEDAQDFLNKLIIFVHD